MKVLKTTYLFIFLIISGIGFSQTFNMTTGTDSTCSGTFYDSGGAGLYANSSNITQTFCPNAPGRVVKVQFTSFQIEAGFDFLCIYDGPTTASPLIGCYSGGLTALNGGAFKGTSNSGCLTFQFTSDASLALNGWQANISCGFACQPVTAIVDSLNPIADTNNIVKICNGETLNLYGNGSYPQSGTYYNQQNSTSTFTWKTGDGFTFNGQNASHTFNMPGIFDVHLLVTDTNNCTDTTKATRVIISTKPNFRNIAYYPNDTICLGDSARISLADSGLFIPFNPPVLNVSGVTHIPDDQINVYSSIIPVSIFNNSATFGSGYLTGIYLNMEHSWLGDLEIYIICPNGQRATLKENPGGAGTFLGEPVDLTMSVPGIGYTYEFTNTSPSYGTMNNEAGTYSQTYTDVLGTTYTNQDYLPAGTYTPFQNLNTQLNGCPLNGNWTINVRDHLNMDDGYIFYWGLNFDTLIRPPLAASTIQGTRDSSNWSSTTTILSTPGDTSALVSPTASGIHSFTYEVIDDFGCVNDTTVNLYVKPKLKSNAGTDFTTCRLDYQLAPIPTPANQSNNWTYYTSSSSGNSSISNTTSYTPTTTVNEYSIFNYVLSEIVEGCPTYPDTVEITHIQVLNTIDISVSKDTICLPESVTFVNNSDMTLFDSIYWEFGDGNSSSTQGSVSHSYTSPQCYDLKVTLVNSLGCKVDSTLLNSVCAYPTPVADFNYNPFEPIIPESTIDFKNTSIDATSYVWDFAGLGSSTLTDNIFEFPNTDGGIYSVTLTATNDGGCEDIATKLITIKNPLSFWIPSTFTPNDDGLNDNFKVVFNNSSVQEYSLRIFNRWGETIIFTDEFDFEWDGTFKGEQVPNGVYIWQVIGKEEFATESFTKIGHVTLSR